MKLPIYMDYAATTPVDPAVAELMSACLGKDGNFGNPASRSHAYGWRAEEAVEAAREQLAELINADIREIVWTSGATESDNLAIKGVMEAHAEKGRHCITSMIEHKAVLDSFRYLESRGVDVTYLKPDSNGMINPKQVEDALREDTVLVSLMHVNNELGTITDIAKIGTICRNHGVFFHVDAAQSAGKLPIDVQTMKIDLMSLSAHKMYGPKGVGALYVCQQPRVRVAQQLHGGGHERGMRSGTLPTHQIAGFGKAAEIALNNLDKESMRISQFRDDLWQGISGIEGISRNADIDEVACGHLNVCFAGVDSEMLLLSLRELAVSSGSACMSATVEPSYVLKATGMSDADADSSIRFSLGRFTTKEDIESAIEHIHFVYDRLQKAG